jgi:hypothetical protein
VKLFLTHLIDPENRTLLSAMDLLKRHGSRCFGQARSIEEADIVLYVEYGYVGLTDLPKLMSRLRAAPHAKHFLFTESDWPFRVLPGVYPSLLKTVPWAGAWSYLPNLLTAGDDLAAQALGGTEFLFSFLGRTGTHPVRAKVRLLDSSATPCIDVSEGPGRFPGFDHASTYTRLIERSRFVLCPRGFGASSVRIFETMALGRVPVIISDAWRPPPGVPWSDFSVRVREHDVRNIPTLLARFDGEAEKMGRLEQEVCNQHFAPEVFLDTLLTTLMAQHSGLSFSVKATCGRAVRATAWREVRTLLHQARSWALKRRTPVAPQPRNG